MFYTGLNKILIQRENDMQNVRIVLIYLRHKTSRKKYPILNYHTISLRYLDTLKYLWQLDINLYKLWNKFLSSIVLKTNNHIILISRSSSCCERSLIMYQLCTWFITVWCQCQSGSASSSRLVVTLLSSVFSTLSSTSLCTLTTCWQPWDLIWGPTFGGKSTWLHYKW